MIVRIVTIFTAFPTGSLAQCPKVSLQCELGQLHPVCPRHACLPWAPAGVHWARAAPTALPGSGQGWRPASRPLRVAWSVIGKCLVLRGQDCGVSCPLVFL